MSLEDHRQTTLATIPKEILSAIVQQDLAGFSHFRRVQPMPAGIWNTFFSVPQYDLEDLEPCLSHALPRRRIFSHQSQKCALQSEDPDPILFPLSQVCQSLRFWLLTDYQLWVAVMPFRPLWAALIASRIPEDTLLDFSRHDGLCQHVIAHIYPYLSRARAIDLVAPSQHPIHANLSMADYLADTILKASQLTYIDLRFDAGGLAHHTAYKVLVLPNVRKVSLLNSSVLFVGPHVRKLSLVTESTRGTQFYLDILLSGLTKCGELEELHIDSLLYDDHRGLPWEWPAELRPSQVALPHLKHLICAGAYMDGVALLYGLQVPDTLDLHLDIGLYLAEWDGLAFENLCLGWPMLAFSAPSRTRALVDQAWSIYSNGVTVRVTDVDIHDDVPELVDDEGNLIVADGNTVTYPRQPGDNSWFDYDICAFACKSFMPGMHFDDLLNGHRLCHNVVALVVGVKNPPERMFYDGPMPLRTPDYVTLFSASNIVDLLGCLSEPDSSPRSCLGPSRSLTIRHIPSTRDMDHYDSLTIPLDILFQSYASRCHAEAVTDMIVVACPSIADLRISWRWLSHLPELRELTIEGSIFAKDMVALAKWLSRRDNCCSNLGEVRFRNVTGLADVKAERTSQLLQYVCQITQSRSKLRWKEMDGASLGT